MPALGRKRTLTYSLSRKFFRAKIGEPIACVYTGYNPWIINSKGGRDGEARG